MSAARLFREGDVDPAVRDIRDRLAATGDLPAEAGPQSPEALDVFDQQLRDAVRAFQQRRGLLVDGIVGPQTYRAMDGARWALGDRILVHLPGHLLSGDDVAELQEQLLRLGFHLGRVDGLFGPSTDSALRELQRGVGLLPDGTCGPSTLRALSQLLTRSVSGGAAHQLRETEQVRRAGPNLSGLVVVIDPGHGDGDPGVATGEQDEAAIVMDIARRVEGRLSATGVMAVLSHPADTNPDELERAELANSLAADLVVSLHCDASESSSASGVATYFYGHDRPGAWSAVGERLADLIRREVVARTGLVDCQSHPRTWELLRRTSMPSVRLDVGYLSNADNARQLADPAFRDVVADSVVVAIQRLYLGEHDMSSTGVLHLADVLAQAGHPR
ncbi:MAG: N-acetylmuramoyl-L-alanine amidase [Actinomycetales bacterium]